MTVRNRDPWVSCPEAVADGKVCSHAVTVQQIRSWGIDCELVLPHHTEPGQPRHKAVHQAWQAGHLRICSLDPRTMIRHEIVPQTPESVADVMAWIASHRTDHRAPA